MAAAVLPMKSIALSCLLALYPVSALAQAPPPAPSGATRLITSKDIWIDIATSAAVARGSSSRLIVNVINYEDNAVRIRLVPELSPGWKVLPSPLLDAQTLESGDEIDSELQLVVPRDVEVGSSHTVRLVVLIEGDDGVAEGLTNVRVHGGGGLKPGQSGVTGNVTAYEHGIDLELGQRGDLAFSADFAGPVGGGTTLSAMFKRGPRLDQGPILSSYVESRDRYALSLRNNNWILSGGNDIVSAGGSISGPFMRSEGASLRRMNRRIIGELTVGRPIAYTNEPGGLLARGNASVTFGESRIGLIASAVQRPATTYTRSDTIRGAGLEADLRLGRHVRLSGKGGVLRIANDTSAVVTGYPIEGQLNISAGPLIWNARARSMPASLPTTYLLPDELGTDLSIGSRLLRFAVRGQRFETERIGQVSWLSENASAGFVLTAATGARLDLRANWRRTTIYTSADQRTGSATVAIPVGLTWLDGAAEFGNQNNNSVRSPITTLRVGLRANQAYASVSYYDFGTGEPRLRGDLRTSLRSRFVDLDGGMWASRGPSYGGQPGAWANLALPVGAGFSLIVGGEYVQRRVPYVRYIDPVTGEPLSPEIADDPTRAPFIGLPVNVHAGPWRATLGIRRSLVVPFNAGTPN
jgi:hypothetical protein